MTSPIKSVILSVTPSPMHKHSICAWTLLPCNNGRPQIIASLLRKITLKKYHNNYDWNKT